MDIDWKFVVTVILILCICLLATFKKKKTDNDFRKKFIRRRDLLGVDEQGNPRAWPGTMQPYFMFCPNSENVYHSCSPYCIERYCPEEWKEAGERLLLR